MEKPDTPDLELVARWTTGRNEDEQLVALLAVTIAGRPIALALDPQDAITLGEELAEQGLSVLAVRGREH